MDDVLAAAARLDGVVHRTPVLTSAELDRRTGARVVLKAENFQRTGSFKLRGAYNAVASLAPGLRAAGICSFSSGNHAQAVALAAALHGVPVVVVMPRDAPVTKRWATEGYGAEVIEYERSEESRREIAERIAAERGMTIVPPFDLLEVMAGQGTLAVELLDEAGPLDVVLVPVGGGGLIAGCATAVRARCPSARVIGVEPAAGDDARRSLAAGRIVDVGVPHTIADGQQTTRVGDLTFEVMRRLVEEVVVVSDDEIVEAMRFAFQRLKIVLEPSGASALAALLSGRVPGIAGTRVGVVLSGGNVDLDRFCTLLAPS
jgi:threonine dehydratase